MGLTGDESGEARSFLSSGGGVAGENVWCSGVRITRITAKTQSIKNYFRLFDKDVDSHQLIIQFLVAQKLEIILTKQKRFKREKLKKKKAGGSIHEVRLFGGLAQPR